MQITDRSKDVIKSVGEWISSVELANVAVGCPGVAEAAAIGIAHPTWHERPLLDVVSAGGSYVPCAQNRHHLAARLANGRLPADLVFVYEPVGRCAGEGK